MKIERLNDLASSNIFCSACSKQEAEFVIMGMAYNPALCESCLDILQDQEKPKEKIKAYLFVLKDKGYNSFRISSHRFRNLQEARLGASDAYDVVSIIPESEMEMDRG